MPLLSGTTGVTSFVTQTIDRRAPLVDTEGPRFTVVDIDTTQQRREMGYRQPADMAQFIGRQNRQKGQEGIARTVRDGNFIGHIENYEDARQQMSRLGRRAMQMFNDKEFEVGLKPESRIDIEVRQRGPLDIIA